MQEENKYRLKLHSPLHIGGNQSYTAMQYLQVMKDNELFVFPLEKVMRYLTDEAQIWKFTEFLEKNEHQNSRVANSLDLTGMIKTKMVTDAIYDEFEIQLTAKFPLEKREIAAVLKTSGKPYIPGGTIKSIFRTALTYKYIKDYLVHDQDKLYKLVRIKHDVFNWISSDFNEKMDVLADCFRFVQIQDVMIQDELGVVLQKIASKKENENEDAIEVVLPGAVTQPFVIKINHAGIDAARKGIIKDYRGKVIRFNEQLLNMLNEETLLEAVADYFEAVAKIDQQFWHEQKTKSRHFATLEHKLDQYRNENSYTQPMVRLGKSTGYLWHTIGALFMEKQLLTIANQNMKQLLYPEPKKKQDYPNSFDEYPKSRKFVEISKMDGFDLLGFAQLEQVK